MSSSMAARRLLGEYKQITENPPEGLTAGPIDEENLFEWGMLGAGARQHAVRGWVLSCTLVVSKRLPDESAKDEIHDSHLAPKHTFGRQGVHFNTACAGRRCHGYERSEERWSPVQSVEKVLISVISMMAEPNDESPANVDAAKMWRDDRESFNQMCADNVKVSLGIS